MKTVTNGYKNQIKLLGKEIDNVIRYYNHYQIITENNKYILTEDGKKILTEQIKPGSYQDITAEDIYSSKVVIHGDLLKTMMKELDFEIKQDLKVGSIVDFKFGLKVNGQYEYVDYGEFIVQNKEFNEDTKTYSYVAYDKMLFTMVPYEEQDISELAGAYTLFDLASYCCQYCGLNLGVEYFPNEDREINDDTLSILKNGNFTFRDVLDFITEVTGCSSYMIGDDFVINAPEETGLTLYADSFKDTNVTFSKMYGPINSIVFSRGDDTDFVEIKDDESIAENGVTQLKIKDNPFLEGNDRSDYFEEMFEVLNGLTYTLNDLSSTGVTYLDYFDKFNVEIDDNTYPCLLLNDEIIIEQGLEEKIFTEETEGAEHEYVTSRLDDRGQKWANIQVKKDLGEINLEVGQLNEDLDGKVGDNEIISKINLSPEQITINSNKLSLNGKTIALTSDNINISSNNFSVDTNGNMTCNNATMSNATITSGNITIPESSAGYGVEVHGTGSDGTTTYYTRQRSAAFSCFRNDVLTARMHDGGNTGGGVLNLYNSSGTMTIQCAGSSGIITCTSVNPSLEENKKNIEKFSNGLQVVKDTDIYRFNYKYEEDNVKRHIGFVIGDKYNYSKEVTSNDNDGADLYAMISVLWQAVKEQQKEIEDLKERIGK